MPERGGPGPHLRQFLRWVSSRRVVVRDESMLPTLLPGDRLRVDTRAYRRSPPRVGELVVAIDPEAPDRWLVKRVASVTPLPGPTGRTAVTLLSDRPDGARDSRRFGEVAVERLIGRVYARYAPPARRGPL